MDAITSRPAKLPPRAEPGRERPQLRVLLASPRGFCAGVTRAIEAVERALQADGAPIYVRRPIVHNMSVVRSLEARGAVFIHELDEAPAGSTVVLSAHGVAREILADGERLGLKLVDAICPLVAKVHREVRRHVAQGRHVILIGHAGHPEIDGTLGQVPVGTVTVVNAAKDIDDLALGPGDALAYAVQTTFSVEEGDNIVAALLARFSNVAGPAASDICYATSNRQRALRAIAPQADAIIVAGEKFSSNANRLFELAEAEGCRAQLVASSGDIDWGELLGVATLGLTSAASTPESIIQEIIRDLRMRYRVQLEEVGNDPETATFKPVAI